MAEDVTEKQDDVKFEEALGRLEQIVAKLENGGLPLEESLAQFEEGMRLNKLCQAKLAEAEQKIERLVRKEDGTLSWEEQNKPLG